MSRVLGLLKVAVIHLTMELLLRLFIVTLTDTGFLCN